ncbi:MAG: hypothetical protein ABJH45_08955 [Paracoccaceae bacterium]
MKTVLSLFASISLLFTTSVASFAQSNKVVTYSDVAFQHCAAEWERFTELESDEWVSEFEAGFIQIELGMDDTTDAVNKFTAAAIMVGTYWEWLKRVSLAKNQNKEYFDVSTAGFDVLKCLLPTESERNLVEERRTSISKERFRENDSLMLDAMLDTVDLFDCSQLVELVEIILNTESFPFNPRAIISAHMKEKVTCK